MSIIPAIDLQMGKAVQLEQGRRKRLEVDDPLALASEFTRYGEIAVVDLDAACGHGDNRALVRELCRRVECRVGGGVRSIETARRIVSWGAARVIVASAVFREGGIDTGFLRKLGRAIGRERIVVALDCRSGRIVTGGWTQSTGIEPLHVLDQLQSLCGGFLYTGVEREGLMAGADADMAATLRARTALPLTVAGGVGDAAEVERLARMGCQVQLGMAVYSGRLSLADAVLAAVDWRHGLVPTIACDEDGQVLMLAYSSRRSLARTFADGCMWYESRSRGCLWRKGETSGHAQQLLRLRLDCDRDALLATVRQTGVACHLGSYSCFGDRRFTLDELQRVVTARLRDPRPESYTASLTAPQVRLKLLEEANELAEAVGREEIVWEAADVLYFLTALITGSGVPLADVVNELQRRRRA